MGRCHGKTKSGARCRRSIRDDARFCAMHAGQAEKKPREPEATREPEAASEAPRECEPMEMLVILGAAGAALLLALAFRRFFRFA